LGNHEQCFECGHEQALGDRCLSFLFEPNCFETSVSAVPGARTAAFPGARLPPLSALTPVIAAAELAAPDGIEDVAFDLDGTQPPVPGNDGDYAERSPAIRLSLVQSDLALWTNGPV
jgi:hypothetical protein